MKQFIPSQQDHVLAVKRGLTIQRVISKRSVCHGELSIHGALGEIAVKHILGDDQWDFVDHKPDLYHADLKHRTTGVTVEVKTRCVKPSTMNPPRSSYSVHLARTSWKQRADFFVFCYTNTSMSEVWILGCLPQKDKLRRGKFLRKGQQKGWMCHRDHMNIQIRDLNSLDKIYDHISKRRQDDQSRKFHRHQWR